MATQLKTALLCLLGSQDQACDPVLANGIIFTYNLHSAAWNVSWYVTGDTPVWAVERDEVKRMIV